MRGWGEPVRLGATCQVGGNLSGRAEPGRPDPSRPIITLLTDFGLQDIYVGVIKGVILTICPRARLVDLTHQVRPQAVLQGAFLLADAIPYFPRGTVHLAVVDPGVGTARPAVAMETPTALFVAPDNGLLTCVWQVLDEAARDATRIVELNEPRYWLPRVSSTFHGRDVFAPVAAHLAAGLPLERVGQPRRALLLLEGTHPLPQEDGSLLGRIVHIDHFGNCVSNITAEQVAALGPAGAITVEVPGQHLAGLAHTYGAVQPGEPLALIGSAGRLEIALREGNAADQLGLDIGDPVWVRQI